MHARGWKALDIILVTGDSYIDSPFIGVAVIGRVLEDAGYRVGVIGQPDVRSERDIARLGEPRLFWGVSGGSVDSMVANYTSLLKRRRSDDYTPGGENCLRPDRAIIAYTNLIRRQFKRTVPVVLGGIEASLRRVAHYDYWSDRIRGSVLFDAKADFLVYGMGERSVLELAASIERGSGARQIRGICYPSAIGGQLEYDVLPSLDQVRSDKAAFIKMFRTFYQNNDPLTARGLVQAHGSRLLIQNPPAYRLSQKELDHIYALPFKRAQHPFYEAQGKVKALETIRFSIPTHRGCYGECNFCAIAVHEGRTVQWRSESSIVDEARLLAGYPDFKGYIMDLEGPTANMYGFECARKLRKGACQDRRCLYPDVCPSLNVDLGHHARLLEKIADVPGVKKVFVASGLRYDLVAADEDGDTYLRQIVDNHISGQLKVAPEHSEPKVLDLMGKPAIKDLTDFKERFERLNRQSGKKQFLTYYLIAGHPGCASADMRALKRFAREKLRITPEQVQIYLPAPSTYSSLMYYTGMDPFTGKPIFVERDLKGKAGQKSMVAPPIRKQIAPRGQAIVGGRGHVAQ